MAAAQQLDLGLFPTTESTVTFSDVPVPKVTKPQAGELVGFPWAGISTPYIGWDRTQPKFGLDLLKYLEPSHNPVVRTALDTVSQGVFWPGWDILPQNDYRDHPEWADLDAAIVQMLLGHLAQLRDASFQDSLLALLENARIFGVGIAEMVWDPATARRPSTQLIKIAVKPPYNWDLRVDGWANLASAQEMPTGATVTGPDLPAKLLVWPWPGFRNQNWYGESDLLPIRHDILALEAIETAMLQGVRLLSVKPILHWFEAKGMDPGELNSIRRMLLGMDAGSVVSLPMKTIIKNGGEELAQAHKVDVLPDRASAEGLKQGQILRDVFAKRITNELGVPDDLGLSASRASVGSYAKSKTELTLFNSRVVKAQHWLEGAVNRTLIPMMVRWNFSLESEMQAGYRLPAFCFREIEEDALLAHGSMIFEALKLKLITPATAQERLGLPIEDVGRDWGAADMYPLLAAKQAGVVGSEFIQSSIGAPVVGDIPVPVPGQTEPPAPSAPALPAA